MCDEYGHENGHVQPSNHSDSHSSEETALIIISTKQLAVQNGQLFLCLKGKIDQE
jgi:hypothetical protein